VVLQQASLSDGLGQINRVSILYTRQNITKLEMLAPREREREVVEDGWMDGWRREEAHSALQQR
jgi:hypothetical protein